MCCALAAEPVQSVALIVLKVIYNVVRYLSFAPQLAFLTNVHSLFEIYGSSIHICCFVLRTQARFPLKVTQPKSWEAKARRVAGSPKPSFPANLGELWSLECVQDLGLEQEIL